MCFFLVLVFFLCPLSSSLVLFLLLPHYARSFWFCFRILAAFPFQEEGGRRNTTIKTKQENKKGTFERENVVKQQKEKVLRTMEELDKNDVKL